MAKWTVVWDENDEGTIVKDYTGVNPVDVSWLPSNILSVQSDDGVTCEIEYGDRSTDTSTTNETVSTSSLSWWSNVSSVFDAAIEDDSE